MPRPFLRRLVVACEVGLTEDTSDSESSTWRRENALETSSTAEGAGGVEINEAERLVKPEGRDWTPAGEGARLRRTKSSSDEKSASPCVCGVDMTERSDIEYTISSSPDESSDSVE